MLPYRSAPGIPCVRFALRKGRGLSEPQITQIALMGYDAPRRFAPGRCLYRGLRVLSEPRITLIAQMGCDGAAPFCPDGCL